MPKIGQPHLNLGMHLWFACFELVSTSIFAKLYCSLSCKLTLLKNKQLPEHQIDLLKVKGKRRDTNRILWLAIAIIHESDQSLHVSKYWMKTVTKVARSLRLIAHLGWLLNASSDVLPSPTTINTPLNTCTTSFVA